MKSNSFSTKIRSWILVLLIGVLWIGCFTVAQAQTPATLDRSLALTADSNIVFVKSKLKVSAAVQNLLESAPAKTAFVWTSADKKIATVDTKGLVTGVSPGTTFITCHAKDNKEITATFLLDSVDTR